MNLKCTFGLLILLYPGIYLAQGYYCPQNHSYVNTGMTKAQVIGACGEPQNILDSTDNKIEQRIPVKQLIYLKLNRGAVFTTMDMIYDTWSLPSGSEGLAVEVSIINNKVSGFKMNGAETNALTVCGGSSLFIGDDEFRVYNACGTPSMTNNSYIMQTIPSSQKPEVWVYQSDEYSPQVRMTFIDGILQFISN